MKKANQIQEYRNLFKQMVVQDSSIIEVDKQFFINQIDELTDDEVWDWMEHNDQISEEYEGQNDLLTIHTFQNN